MRNHQWALMAVLALTFGATLGAEIIPEALLSFPAQTQYMEYDNLAALRKLPDYKTLRDRFSGRPLEDAKAALIRLSIAEDQVREIVSGSSSKAFYGVFEGTFSGQAAAIRGRQRGLAVNVSSTEAFCVQKGTCITFLDNSLAAFGTLAELREMLETRQGAMPRLTSNRNVVTLIENTDHQAPVRGVMFGAELNSTLADMLKESTGWNMDWSHLSSNITAMSYSVKFDAKAHVAATLQCASSTAAAILSQTVNAMGSLQSVSASGSVPFQNLRVSSSGHVVDFKADTPLPGAVPSK